MLFVNCVCMCVCVCVFASVFVIDTCSCKKITTLLFLLRLCVHMYLSYTNTPTVKTTTVIPTCPECGIIRKTGKLSCCGRGGSWFGNCGSGENANEHMWSEGMQVCKPRKSQKAADQRQRAPDAKSTASFNNTSLGKRKTKLVIVIAHTSASIPVCAPTSKQTQCQLLR